MLPLRQPHACSPLAALGPVRFTRSGERHGRARQELTLFQPGRHKGLTLPRGEKFQLRPRTEHGTITVKPQPFPQCPTPTRQNIPHALPKLQPTRNRNYVAEEGGKCSKSKIPQAFVLKTSTSVSLPRKRRPPRELRCAAALTAPGAALRSGHSPALSPEGLLCFRGRAEARPHPSRAPIFAPQLR